MSPAARPRSSGTGAVHPAGFAPSGSRWGPPRAGCRTAAGNRVTHDQPAGCRGPVSLLPRNPDSDSPIPSPRPPKSPAKCPAPSSRKMSHLWELRENEAGKTEDEGPTRDGEEDKEDERGAGLSRNGSYECG